MATGLILLLALGAAGDQDFTPPPPPPPIDEAPAPRRPPLDEPAPPAPTAPPRHTAVYLHPLSLVVGEVRLEVEHATTNRLTLFLAPRGHFGFSPLFGPNTTARGFGLTLGARMFPAPAAPKGTFVGVEFDGSLTSNAGVSTTAGLATLMGGYTFVGRDGYAVSLGLGYGTALRFIGTAPPFYEGQVALRLGIGYAF